MKNTFFSWAVATVATTSATHIQNHALGLAAAQTSTQLQLQCNALTLADYAFGPETDITNFSQTEIEALLNSDDWASLTPPFGGEGSHYGQIDTFIAAEWPSMLTFTIPSMTQLKEMFTKNPLLEQIAIAFKSLQKSTSLMVSDMAKGIAPSKEATMTILSLIPGMEDIVTIADVAQRVSKATGQSLGILPTPPDDGLPKSCWIKSQIRRFEWPGKVCNTQTQVVQLKICYDKCPKGKGVGPLCWGKCPTGTKKCGVLCLLEGESCSYMVANVTKDIIAAGTHGASQDYFGLVAGILQVADDFAYPICRTLE